MKIVTVFGIVALLACLPLRGALAQTTRPAISSSATRPSERLSERRRERRERRPDSSFFASTTQPDDVPIPSPQPITGDYLTLMERSIFFKGRFVPSDDPGRFNSGPATPPEKVLVFDGATRTDHLYAAFLEDTESQNVNTIHVGDKIAQGQITRITLDEMDYQAGGRVMHLAIGQNLAGEQIYGADALAATEPSIDLSGPDADILRKMMLRRQQELGGK